MNRPDFHCFTLTSKGGRLAVLRTGCHASASFDPALPPNQHPAAHEFQAIWDTGATGTVISQQVIDRCGLKPTGMTVVHTAAGPGTSETFLINVSLMNGAVRVNDVTVTKGDIKDADLLIGMDIITQGDFSITNVGGNTIFSFRMPSVKTIDYHAEAKEIVEQRRRSQEKKARRHNKHKSPYHK